MALVTVQRSPSPSNSADEEEQDTVDADDSNLKSPRQRRRRSKSALQKLRKLFNTVRFVTKLKPCFSESYFTVKGAALILPQSDYDTAYNRKVTKSSGGDIQSHLQMMFSLLRPQDTIKVAVKLECESHVRYLVVVSCIGRQDTEESVILGIDLVDKANIGMAVPIWAHTHIQLTGDGGFSILVDNNTHIFKPVSVQAMWSALQSINKVTKIATDNVYIPRGLTHTWVGYYESKLTTDVSLVNEWYARGDIDLSYRTKESISSDTDEENLYRRIKTELKLTMMSVDLEEVTCRFLRENLEGKLGICLKEYRSFIDTEMFKILGQMDAPSKILDYLYLGSEWNASNLDELQQNGVNHILNISREIDNFFPGVLHYMNVREWDVEGSDLLKYWKDTHRYINKARKRGSKALVHCKMGISRSASTVIAYLMKENKWGLQEAYEFTKAKRNIINPNSGFWEQLKMYDGILTASRQRDRYNTKDGDGSMSPPKEDDEDDMPLVTAEDFLARELGKDHDLNSEPFQHTEQDIDIASRSADSTDDSIPDNMSPVPMGEEAAAETRKHHHGHKHRRDKEKTESADYDISSDTSEYTESDDIPSSSNGEDDDNDDDNSAPSIDIPGLDLPQVVRRKKTKNKGDARRTKSEGDKASLTVENRIEGFSREGSVAKYKPDGSWIKLEPEESEEATEENADNEASEESKVVEKPEDAGIIWIKGADDIKTEVAIDETESVEKDSEIKSKSDSAIETEFEKMTAETDIVRNVESPILDPYIKENIPWDLGTVQKQKMELESKSRLEASGAKKEDKMDTSDNLKPSTNIPIITLDEPTKMEGDISNEKSELKSCDTVVQSEDIPMETDQSVSGNEPNETGSPVALRKSRRSVYDLEEIDLPEGIVKKTLMEIEERNKQSADCPKKLQRSASLKSDRTTPKAKNRDSERRKTCIAILSPRETDNKDITHTSEHMDISVSSSCEMETTAGSPDHADALLPQASGDMEEEVGNLTGTVKVYKYMGEELTVQEGLVKKQTMDLEHREANVKTPSLKSELEFQTEEHVLFSESSETSSICSNQVTPALSEISIPSVTSSQFSSNISEFSETKNENIDESSLQKVNETKAVFFDKSSKSPDMASEGCVTKRDNQSVTPPRKQSSRPESRFDPKTLELIREIGSALLNSPAKSEMEVEDEEKLEGASLVSHFVKKIERNITQVKKKPTKEIIIIDKTASQKGEQKSKTASELSQSTSTGSNSETKADGISSSKYSPVAKKQIFTHSTSFDDQGNIKATSPKFNETKPASPSWSPVPRKGTMSPVSGQSTPEKNIDNRTNINLHDKQKSDPSNLSLNFKQLVAMETKSEQSVNEEDEEACSVKNLVGKFEHADGENVSGKDLPVFGMPNIQSPSSNTPLLPSANMDIEVVELRKPTTPVARRSAGNLDTGCQGQTQRSPLQHRQSEPAIQLSQKSVMLLGAKLSEESETDTLTPSLTSRGGARPKSAELSQRRGIGGHGAKTKLGSLRQSTLPESSEQFTWEGKKVRKLYGKSHPLAKLEDKSYMESIRNNPFYNTM